MIKNGLQFSIQLNIICANVEIIAVKEMLQFHCLECFQTLHGVKNLATSQLAI